MNRTKALRKTLAVLLSTIVTFVTSLSTMPTMAFAYSDGVTFKFDIGEGASYNTGPTDVYTYDVDSHTYTADEATEIAEGATVTLLPAPDTVPDGKKFIGWSCSDGKWIEGSTVALAALDSIVAGGDYTFTAVYNDYLVNYDFDGGAPEASAGLFLNPEAKDQARGGLDDPDEYTLVAADDVGLPYTYEAFDGWSLNGTTVIEGLTAEDFTEGVVTVQALYSSPATLGNVAYCNAYEGLESITNIDDISTDALITVSGGSASYTIETDPITPVPTEDDTPRGKTLSGWTIYSVNDMSTSLADGVTEDIDLSNFVGDLVFVAGWENATYAISYEKYGGGDFDPAIPDGSYTYSYTDEADIDLPATQSTVTGKYVSWSDGTGYYASEATYTIAADTVGDITFTETPVDIYSVSYEANGGTLPTGADANPESWKVTDGEVLLNDAEAGDAEYAFDGWRLANATEFVDPDNPITGPITALNSELFAAVVGDSVELVASWTAVDHTITLTGLTGVDSASVNAIVALGFELDNETNPTQATISKTVEDSLTIPAITMDGHRFIKWDDGDAGTDDGETVVLEAGDITSDLSYNAVFVDEYTLTLSKLSGITADSVDALEDAGFTVSGSSATLKFVSTDGTVTLPNLDKDGYDFVGWYLSTASDSTAAKNVVFDCSTAANTKYYAKFVRSYTVTFMDGDTELTDLGFTYVTGAAAITLPELPDRTGYTSDGWTLQGDETQTLYAAGTLQLEDIGIEVESDEVPLVFDTNYTIIERTITLTGLTGVDSASVNAIVALGFELDNETNPTQATISKTVEDSLTIPAITMDGHRFIKWDDGDAGTDDGKTVVLEAGDITSDLAYEAKFAEEYTLTLSGLTGVSENSLEAIEGLGFTVSGDTATYKFIASESTFDIPNPIMDDHEFLGWYAGEDPSGATKDVTFDPSTAADAALTASFVRVYQVTFMDGDTELTDLGFTYRTGADKITLPVQPDKTGYTSKGWTLAGNETSTTYQSGDLALSTIGIDDPDDELDLTFNAKYKIISRTITLTGLTGIDDDSIAALGTGEGGLGFTFDSSTNPTQATISKTVEDSLTIPAITMDGYRFIKWDDGDVGTEDDTTVVLEAGDITDDLTYEAKFAEEHTLTLSGLSGVSENSLEELEDLGFTVTSGTATYGFIADDPTITLPNLTKDNYEFLGWYETGEDPSGAVKDVTFNPSTAADAGFTASFIRAYKVTFMDGDTELTALGFTYRTGADKITLPAVPDKTGYNKNGWRWSGDEAAMPTMYDAGEVNLSSFGIQTTDDEKDLVFIADYSIISRTITLNGLAGVDSASVNAIVALGFELDNEINPTQATISKTIEDSLTIPAITKLHKVFDGWKKGTDDPYAPVVLEAGDIDDDITYEAIFSDQKHVTVAFTLNDGAFLADDIAGWDAFGYEAGVAESFTVYADDDKSAVATIPAPQKADNVFDGWTVNGGEDKLMGYALPEPDDQDIAMVANWTLATEGETVVEKEGNGKDTVNDATASAIEDILDDNVGTGETSVTKFFIEEDTTGAGHAGSDIDGDMDDIFDGATVLVTKSFVEIDITQYITSATQNSVANPITDLGQVVDIAYTPTSGTANLKAIVREHGNPATRVRFRQLTAAPVPGEFEDGTYFVDGNVVHIYTQFFSTYGFAYATGVYKVSFDANGGNETYDPVYTNQLGALPPDPTRSGNWSFISWTYSDGTPAAVGDAITADTTIIAQWKDTTPTPPGPGPSPGPGPEPSSYTVTFDANGGTPVSPITVTDGKLPTLPTTTKENNTFDGWLYANGTKAASGDAISGDVTLTASWIENPPGTYTVTFDANGGVAVDPITVSGNVLPTLPTTTKENNTFDGWLYANGTKAAAGDPINSDITLTAKWIPDVVTPIIVYFDANGGSEVSPITVTDGKLPELPVSKRDKYTFDAWLYADGTTAKAGDPISATITLTAKWTKVKEPTPTDIVPTKNGVVVAANSDGTRTVTLLDGSKYGTKPSINTVKGTDGKTYKITRIWDEAFKGNTAITKVSIGSNVTAIGDSAFEDCTNLKSASFGSKVRTIGDRAFAGTAITKANISGKTESIGEYAFYGCTNLKSASIAGLVTTIGESAFEGCTSMTSAKIGKTVKTISARAFFDCKAMTSLNIGAGVTLIGVDAFSGCTALSKLTIGMANIPDELFKDWTSLTKLTVGSTTRTIGSSAFEGCTNLKSASYGSKLEMIGDRAFASSGVTKANISGRVTTVGQYAFYNCPNLASASTGKYVKTIGESAFQNCPKLKSAGIGANVETIGNYAFADCGNLRSANIGKSVRTIGEYAYANCTSMTSTTIGKSVTSIGIHAYSGDAKLKTVKVNSKNLTNQDAVGLDCLSGILATATIKIPKAVFDQTKAAFEAKSGAGNQVTYRKV